MTDEQKQYESQLRKIIIEVSTETIKKYHESIDKERRERHTALLNQIAALSDQIKPMTRVYNAFDGFGNIASWSFKFFIIPLSAIVGLILEIRHLTSGK